MKLSELVCNVSLCWKLREIGIYVDSYFQHVVGKACAGGGIPISMLGVFPKTKAQGSGHEHFPAPTSVELCNILLRADWEHVPTKEIKSVVHRIFDVECLKDLHIRELFMCANDPDHLAEVIIELVTEGYVNAEHISDVK